MSKVLIKWKQPPLIKTLVESQVVPNRKCYESILMPFFMYAYYVKWLQWWETTWNGIIGWFAMASKAMNGSQGMCFILDAWILDSLSWMAIYM